MLRTNTKQHNANVRQFIISNIAEDINGRSESAQIDWIAEDLDRQVNYEYNLKRLPNFQDRIADYLQGLPYSFVACYNDEMIEQACLFMEVETLDEKLGQKIIANYYNFMAFQLIKLINSNK